VTGWLPTAAIVRSTTTAAVVSLAALVLGRPDLLVLAAPFGIHLALALAHTPSGGPDVQTRLTDRWVREGQTTRWRIRVGEPADLDQLTATLAPPAFVVVTPASGAVSATPRRGADPVLEFAVSPRRWGVRSPGAGLVAATSCWGGWRWGPAPLPEPSVVALPTTSPFSSTQSPHPVGLIGQHPARRAGDGSEFWAVRPFQPGDRLRRVNWRTTLRTGRVHAVGTAAQEDSSVLLLIDAVADVGTSGGVDGEASSLDVTVRAAGALAGHHVRLGDRVAVRVLGRSTLTLGPGTGVRHQRRILELLSQVQPGWPDLFGGRHLRFRAEAGTVVVVLSPLLTPEITTTMVTLARRGLTVLAVDTLPPEALPRPARDPHSAGRLAWRMRLLERDTELTEVARQGIPVVPWRGPGTLDEVLRRLARRNTLPRAVAR